MKNFTCNLCGVSNLASEQNFHRELPSCSFCSSTVRMRELAWHLKLFVGSTENMNVVGLSDHPAIEKFSETLKCNYTNTFFNEIPELDISNPGDDWLGVADVLISSDVMEHVMPPLSRAFRGHFDVLKPGGKMILTTPYFSGCSFVEKYPHMVGYKVDENSNVIAYGKDYDSLKILDPVFHGGPGNTLEMRLFAPETIQEGLEIAGFTDIVFHEQDIVEHGIIRSETKMGTITAIKPLGTKI